MNEERIITAAVITTGEKSDGKYLQTLIEKSRETGMEMDTVIGDTAYSEKDNIRYANRKNVQFGSKLHPIFTQGARKKEDEFEFNKDVGMYVCKAGHMAIRKARTGKKGTNNNQSHTYYFDIEKCKVCPFKSGCYKEGAKSKTYSVTMKSTEHKKQQEFQESAYFKEKEEKQKLMEKIDRLERELDSTQTKLLQIQHIVEKIVQIAFSNDFKQDLDYISLLQCLNGDESYQVKMLPYHVEKQYRKTGEAPTLEEYHDQLLERLKIEESDKINYSINLSVNMLKDLKDPIYMNEFTFLNKTLED